MIVIHDPQNDDEYNKLAGMLDQLLDIVGDNESHELQANFQQHIGTNT